MLLDHVERKLDDFSELNLATTIKDNFFKEFINTLTTKGGPRKNPILYWTQRWGI